MGVREFLIDRPKDITSEKYIYKDITSEKYIYKDIPSEKHIYKGYSTREL